MERFLERVALSKYRNNFILKGGMLVSSMVGLNTRATMDIDTTVRFLSISKENAEKVIGDIIAVNIPDGSGTDGFHQEILKSFLFENNDGSVIFIG